MYTMYTIASNITPPYTHVMLYVIWRVHPLGSTCEGKQEEMGAWLVQHSVHMATDGWQQPFLRGDVCVAWLRILVTTTILSRTRFQLGIAPNLFIPHAHLCVPSNPKAHPNTTFSKIVWHNPYAPTHEHMNKWESILHMDGYYVVKVIVTPYLRYGSIITIVSKEEKHTLCP